MTTTKLKNVQDFYCPACQKAWPPDDSLMTCPDCAGNLHIRYDYAALGQVMSRASLARDPERSMWRYAALLPVAGRLQGPPVGWTPLVDAPRLAQRLGLRHLQIKDDGRNPSASFKDRASAVALQRARDLGLDLVVGASTGNAASSTATLAAANGMRARIFIPKSAPKAKIAQLLAFGAELILVDGTYDQAFDLCASASHRQGWFNRNTGFNPYTREGKKTVAFEIAEQRDWHVPDVVAVAVGDGNIISGVHKGFVELRELGLTDRVPRLLAVQAQGSDAVVRAWESKGPIVQVGGETVADSISVSLPRDGEAARQAIVDSQGWGLRVADDEILAAIPELAQHSGVFAEPAGATPLAGVKKALEQGLIRADDQLVLLVTGNGLKDVGAVLGQVQIPQAIRPDEAALDGYFSK